MPSFSAWSLYSANISSNSSGVQIGKESKLATIPGVVVGGASVFVVVILFELVVVVVVLEGFMRIIEAAWE